MKKGRLTVLLLVCSIALLRAQPVSEYGTTGQEVRVFNTSRVNTEGLEFCPAVYENGLVFKNTDYVKSRRIELIH